MIVVTNIGSRICYDMSELIFAVLYLVKINYVYAFGHCCLSEMCKIEVIKQYCAINFLNLLVKASASDIILLIWCTIEK